jgi:hypothetical protein
MVCLAVVLSLHWIQVEGNDGWAASLPGHHLRMTLFLIAVVPLPFFFVRSGR